MSFAWGDSPSMAEPAGPVSVMIAWWLLERALRLFVPRSSILALNLCAEVRMDGSTVGWIERRRGTWVACSGNSRFECVSLLAAVFYLRKSANNS